MATLPKVFRRTEAAPAAPEEARRAGARGERDKYLLRPLPQENLYFHLKRIDNSRLVREDDPKARGACWSAIAVAAAVLMLVTATVAPIAGNMLAGYKVQELNKEQLRLMDERRGVELKLAGLLSQENLEKLARDHSLVPPGPGQVIHLDNRPDSSVAMVQ
jgi:hypothetical protein